MLPSQDGIWTVKWNAYRLRRIVQHYYIHYLYRGAGACQRARCRNISQKPARLLAIVCEALYGAARTKWTAGKPILTLVIIIIFWVYPRRISILTICYYYSLWICPQTFPQNFPQLLILYIERCPFSCSCLCLPLVGAPHERVSLDLRVIPIPLLSKLPFPYHILLNISLPPLAFYFYVLHNCHSLYFT